MRRRRTSVRKAAMGGWIRGRSFSFDNMRRPERRALAPEAVMRGSARGSELQLRQNEPTREEGL